MLLMENIKLAVNAIRVNKMRAFLTMLGIIIGISSVIAITSIGSSASGAIEDLLNSQGRSYMYIMPSYYIEEDYGNEVYFTIDDVEALKNRFPDNIEYAAPYAYENTGVSVGSANATLGILGVENNYEKFNTTVQIKYGRMINEKDIAGSKNNIVIPVACAERLFGREDVVGKQIPAVILGNSVDLTIVGVYDTEDSLFNTLVAGSSTFSCYMPYSAIFRSDWISYYIEIYANEEEDMQTQALSFTTYLERYKDFEPDTYIYESTESQMGIINEVLGYLAAAIGAIAAISLLVGGIGIMNIMLVSVTERTREIGIRKSLGARTKDILTQFLIEAMILSCFGGIIGTLFGIGVTAIGTMIVGVRLVINPLSIILAVSFSAIVGLFFGLFPARKAARLDPIEALRYE